MRHVPNIDASGIHILEELAREADRDGYIHCVFGSFPKRLPIDAKKWPCRNDRQEEFAADIFAALEIAKAYLETAGKEEQK